MTIQLEFTPEIQAQLQYERYHPPHPIVQRRMETLWLKSQGLPQTQIAQLAGISPHTMREYFRLYQAGGMARLKELHLHRPPSDLAAHTVSWEAHFRADPPATIKAAQSEIETLTGMRRSETQVRHYLKTLGLRCRQVGMLPAKADPEVPATYLETELEPRLAKAQAGQGAVFLVDAAHFVLAPFLGFLGCFARMFIQAPAGRQRFNVLGALNAITHDLVMVTNDTSITATEVCTLLHKLADLHVTLPITVVLDNARYQKCALVLATAAEWHIE